MPGNYQAWEVYRRCSTQCIIGPDGPVDIDIRAIKIVMDLHRIRDQAKIMDRVQKTFREIIGKQKIAWQLEREVRRGR